MNQVCHFSGFQSFIIPPLTKPGIRIAPELPPMPNFFPSRSIKKHSILCVSKTYLDYEEDFSKTFKVLVWSGSRYCQRWSRLPELLSDSISQFEKIVALNQNVLAGSQIDLSNETKPVNNHPFVFCSSSNKN